MRISTEDTCRYVSRVNIGFAMEFLNNNGIDDAASAGSGTLVMVGKLHGILTAAHVLDALPPQGRVGIITHLEAPHQYQKPTIRMEHTEPPVILRGDTFGPDGPDLAFLKLPDENIGWLAAKYSFYNLTRRRDDVLAGRAPSQYRSDTLTGTVQSFTSDAPSNNPRTRHKLFYSAMWQAMLISAEEKEFDLDRYIIMGDPTLMVPESIAGTSGGSVWRTYVVLENDKPRIIEQRLIGVPFFESTSHDGTQKIITCHGPKGIYGRLIDNIFKRWPDAAA